MRRLVLALAFTALLIPLMGTLEPAEAGVHWNAGVDFSVGGLYFSLGFADRGYNDHSARYFYRTRQPISHRGYRCGSACYIDSGYSYHHRACPLLQRHFLVYGFDAGYHHAPFFDYRYGYGPWRNDYRYRYDRNDWRRGKRYDRRYRYGHKYRYDHRYDRRHRQRRYDRDHDSDRRHRYERRDRDRRRDQRYDRKDRDRRRDQRYERRDDRRDDRGRRGGADRTRSRRRDN